MVDFDYQWKNIPDKNLEYNSERVKEFLKFTKLNPKKVVKNKLCLDAGCGIGRYTYALMELGAKVDSIDISSEGVKKCKEINPNAKIQDILKLESTRKYDFVLSWGVLHHTPDPRLAFSKVASQVKPDGGYLHVMLYHKDTQKIYEEGREIWQTLSEKQRIQYCKKKIDELGWGTVHGWYDALNPKYNFSYSEKEIKNWFEDEGFSKIRIVTKHNININGQLLEKKSFISRFRR